MTEEITTAAGRTGAEEILARILDNARQEKSCWPRRRKKRIRFWRTLRCRRMRRAAKQQTFMP